MRQMRKQDNLGAEAQINAAERDLTSRMEDAMHDKIIVSAQTISMKDAERDEQIYQEMATLKDENSVLKEKIESLAN